MIAALLLAHLVLGTTTTISGTTDIEDAFIRSADGGGAEHYNTGGHTVLLGCYGGTIAYRSVMRVAAAAIPAGTITGFRLKFWQAANAASTDAGNLDAYIVKNANEWVEGTGVGVAAEVGSCDWNEAKHAVTGWAGGTAGCGISGTDYDTDASPPTYAFSAFTIGSDTLRTISLPTAWAVAWRDATRTNNGIMLRARSEVDGQCVVWYSTENATHQPYFEVDTAAGGVFWGLP